MLVTGAVLGPPPGNEQSENDNRHGSRAQFRRLDTLRLRQANRILRRDIDPTRGHLLSRLA